MSSERAGYMMPIGWGLLLGVEPLTLIAYVFIAAVALIILPTAKDLGGALSVGLSEIVSGWLARIKNRT